MEPAHAARGRGSSLLPAPGGVLWALGNVDRAPRLTEEALSLALTTGHIPTVAVAHAEALYFAVDRRKPDQAMPHAEALLELAHEHGLLTWLPIGTFLLGWARWWAGDREAEAAMREGFRLAGEIGFRVFEPRSGMLLAEVEAEAGRVEAGLAILDAQRATIEQTGQRSYEAELNRVRGELLLRLEPPDHTGAEAAYTRAIAIARNQLTRTFELRAALSLAKLYHATGRTEDVRELLGPALVGFSVGSELPEVAEAERLLAEVQGYQDAVVN